MAVEVTLPRQGWSMEEAAFVEWLKKDGDEVRVGEPLFAVETDKAVQEIESLDAGLLRLGPQAPQNGDTVRVGDVLGYLVAAGEEAPFAASARAPKQKEDPAAAPPAVSPAAKTAFINPVTVVRPSGRAVSPRAARRAIREGVDLRTLQGTGRGGRIRESDVLAALKGAPDRQVGSAVSNAGTEPVPGRDVAVTALRRTIAARMHRSKTLTAPVTLTTRVDARALVRLRERLKETAKTPAVPSYGDIIMRQVALTLAEHPALNARWEDHHLRFPDAISIGFAVDTEAGLAVPVVRDTPKLSLAELAALTRDLAARARQRRLTAAEQSGGTFTITNLGMLGIEGFTPIINWPECAVLGIGRITREPVADGDAVVLGERLWLSLTFDHRIVDGAPAARFLEALRLGLENLP